MAAVLGTGPRTSGEPASSLGERSTDDPKGLVEYQRTIDSSDLEKYSKPRSFWGKLLEWVAGPADRPFLGRPYGLTEDNLGRLIVADPALRVVHILDFERRRYNALTKAKRESFLSPIGVAVDSEDNIYVSDSARARIYVFNRKGKFQRTMGGGRNGLELKRPTGLAIDSERSLLYLTDTLRHQVLVLTLDGKLVKALGRRGTEPGEYNFPTSLTLAGGYVYVVDAMNFRIQVLTPEGEFVRSFGELGNRNGMLNRPKGIAVDSDGNVYVVDALFETIQVFDSEGRLLSYFGSTGTAEGQFTLPSGIHIAPRGRIYVADSYNRRVQIFRYRRVEP